MSTEGFPWQEVVDSATKQTFFYNQKTGVSQWNKPEGFPSADVGDASDAESINGDDADAEQRGYAQRAQVIQDAQLAQSQQMAQFATSAPVAGAAAAAAAAGKNKLTLWQKFQKLTLLKKVGWVLGILVLLTGIILFIVALAGGFKKKTATPAPPTPAPTPAPTPPPPTPAPTPSGGTNLMSGQNYYAKLFGTLQTLNYNSAQNRISWGIANTNELPILFRLDKPAVGGQLFFGDNLEVQPFATDGFHLQAGTNGVALAGSNSDQVLWTATSSTSATGALTTSTPIRLKFAGGTIWVAGTNRAASPNAAQYTETESQAANIVFSTSAV
jgi:hypothetical protein